MDPQLAEAVEEARPRAVLAPRRSLAGPMPCLVAIVSATTSLVLAALVAGYFTVTPRRLRRPAS